MRARVCACVFFEYVYTIVIWNAEECYIYIYIYIYIYKAVIYTSMLL